jgi:hypothetical protein
VAAGKCRRPWNDVDREFFRQVALKHQPWLRSTGPRTARGKARSALNGLCRRPCPNSRRQLSARARTVGDLVQQMAEMRRAMGLA